MASRRAAFAPLSAFHPSALVAASAESSSLQEGQRLAKPGLPGLSSNSSPQTTQVLIGCAINKMIPRMVSYGAAKAQTTEGHEGSQSDSRRLLV